MLQKEFPSVSSVTGGVSNHSDINIQPATTKPTEKTQGRGFEMWGWGLSVWGGARRGGGGARIKKTTLNKKTDSHISLSGCRICFYSASNKKKNGSK